jgi:hypothetical protein
MADEAIERSRAGLFVLRIAGEEPSLSGRVEHVLTGEKCVFNGLEELGEALVRMTRRDRERWSQS